MKKIASILIALIFISSEVIAQQTPGNTQKDAITLLGGIAHIGNGTTIENSAIVFENGVGEPVEKVTDKKEPNKVTPDTPVEDLKIVNQMYAYNPNPNKLRTPDGQIVDFIIA